MIQEKLETIQEKYLKVMIQKFRKLNNHNPNLLKEIYQKFHQQKMSQGKFRQMIQKKQFSKMNLKNCLVHRKYHKVKLNKKNLFHQ